MDQRHFLSVKEVTKEQIQALFATAQQWLTPIPPPALLKHKTVANLFLENSTRTRCSFELAAKRLGADVLNFNFGASSQAKGETLLDTVANLQALGVDLFVVRHAVEGMPARIAQHLGAQASVINAGDGCHEHPTQAMLDAFTIQHYKGKFKGLRVAIIGDVKHSRVANSVIAALLTLEVNEIHLIGPAALLPQVLEPEIKVYEDLTAGIADADIVMVLRLQRERMQEGHVPNQEVYFRDYGLTAEKLRYAKPDAIVMHPGPINRGVEIASEVADGPQSVILSQVRFGVVVRMAIMSHLLIPSAQPFLLVGEG